MNKNNRKSNLLNFQNKRINKLFSKTTRRLDKNTWKIIKSRIIQISFCWENSFNFKINGEVNWIDKQKTKCNVYLNLFTLRIFSKEAVTGVIAHELAHIFIEYKKTSKFRSWLHKYQLIDLEKQADNLAKVWGFKKEINQMIKEAKIIERTIPFKVDYSSGSINEKYIHLSLVCSNCKKSMLENIIIVIFPLFGVL